MDKCTHINTQPHHINTQPHWNYVSCKDCGAILVGLFWGSDSREWVPNMGEAKLYAEQGKLLNEKQKAQSND